MATKTEFSSSIRLTGFIIALLFISQEVLGSSLTFDDRLPRQQIAMSSTFIRPIECRNTNNQSELGVCMFSIDCMHNKGVPLSVCKHNYFVGTCCRLPDYNNFVGIVYDLRDTESGYLLEARKVTSEAQLKTNDSSKSPATGSPQLNSVQDTNQTAQQQSTVVSSIPDSTSTGPLLVADDKYVISSSSLFASSASPTSQSSMSESTKQPSESARNSDGSLSTDFKVVELKYPPKLATDGKIQHVMTLQLSPSNIATDINSTLHDKQNPQANNVMIKDDTTQSDTISSSHSPPTRRLTTRPDSISQTQSAENSTMAPPQSTTSTLKTTDFSDSQATHRTSQSIESTARSQTLPSFDSTYDTSFSTASISSETTNDQEFTLSSNSSPSVGPVDLIHLTNPSQSTQTTTPFTTSLSTAQLPNVSSYQYHHSPSPSSSEEQQTTTQKPQTKPVSLMTSFQEPQSTEASSSSLPPLVPSSPNQQFSVSLPTSSPAASNASIQSRQPVSHPAGSLSTQTKLTEMFQPATSFGYGQLYSSHHSYHPNTPSKPILSTLSTIPASLKTVSPSHGSSSNNLIPNLSNIQSAILSHIPFKIATGLSSGLSNYLQAAMKPNGGRPLMASNTAPALQYQQGIPNVTIPTMKPLTTQSGPTGSHIRFPSHTSTETHLVTTTNPPSQTPNPSINVSGQINLVLQESFHSSLREAQLVCGRPQSGNHHGPSIVTAAQSTPSSNSEAKKRVARIVGGNQSIFGQWPWMVSLRQWRRGAFLHKCGAALLSDNWAITAAHCVENVKPSDLLLRLGEFDVSNQNEPYPYIERRVKTVVSHPSFDPKTFEYDLALLRFTEPIKYEHNIIPVCIPSGNDSYVDRIATVIGWGRLYEDGPLPDVIQHVDVPIITNQECEKMYKSAGFIEEIPDIFICAGINKGGRDSCEGDSGGPLTMIDNDGRSYLVGIISWGIGCALPSQPGVYTRITTFSNWINENIAFP